MTTWRKSRKQFHRDIPRVDDQADWIIQPRRVSVPYDQAPVVPHTFRWGPPADNDTPTALIAPARVVRPQEYAPFISQRVSRSVVNEPVTEMPPAPRIFIRQVPPPVAWAGGSGRVHRTQFFDEDFAPPPPPHMDGEERVAVRQPPPAALFPPKNRRLDRMPHHADEDGVQARRRFVRADDVPPVTGGVIRWGKHYDAEAGYIVERRTASSPWFVSQTRVTRGVPFQDGEAGVIFRSRQARPVEHEPARGSVRRFKLPNTGEDSPFAWSRRATSPDHTQAVQVRVRRTPLARVGDGPFIPPHRQASSPAPRPFSGNVRRSFIPGEGSSGTETVPCPYRPREFDVEHERQRVA